MTTTINDYLVQHKDTMMDELKDLLEVLKDLPDEEFTKERFIELTMELASDTALIYNHGFAQCMKLVEQADVTFLQRKLPPHLQ